MDDLQRYLAMIAADRPVGRFLEVRYRREIGMGQRFLPACDLTAAATLIRRVAEHTDCYLGAALRDRRHGGAGAVSRSRLVFCELDDPTAVRRLASGPRPPTMLVTSGTPGHAHAYWQLTAPITGSELKLANTRLALGLGGDLASVDQARILRPPLTFNHKHHPAAPVRLVGLDQRRRYPLEQLLDGLPDPPTPAPPRRLARQDLGDDLDAQLRAIPAAEYAAVLTGRQPSREGKIACPFHEDRTPSLHLYDDGSWCCFGCRHGGSIYDFAARLWNIETRGRDFLTLRARLADQFGLPAPPVAPRPTSAHDRGGARPSLDRDPTAALRAADRGGR